MQMVGKYRLVLRDSSGAAKHEEEGRNLVTTLGEELAADRFSSVPAGSAPGYVTLGSGTTAPTKADEDLETPIAASDTAVDSEVVSDNQVALAVEIDGPGAGSWNVNEVGIFNEADGDPDRILVARFLTENFVVAIGDKVDVTWALEFEGID